jgi:Txe/YoeB family toxin of Txe-Axe toxin-antitoxin module
VTSIDGTGYVVSPLDGVNVWMPNLEALKGDLAGKHSIRINDQWRVAFRWTDAGPKTCSRR